MSREYVLHSRWHLAHSRATVWGVLVELLDTEDPMPWWPGVAVLDYSGDRLSLRVRSRLGYALTVHLSDLVTEPPTRLSFRASGDLSGMGVVDIVEADHGSTVDIDWRVEARTAWMRRSQWLLRPVFIWGHRWVMHRGHRHLDRWMTGR